MSRLSRTKGRQRPEQTLQIQVANYLGVALKPPVLWSAFPAGGGGAIRGAILKSMGLQAGWPDVLVMAPGPIVVGIELKAGKGKQSPQQIYIQNGFIECKATYRVCRSVDEVEGFLRGVGVPLHATVGAVSASDAGKARASQRATPNHIPPHPARAGE